mgnify:CR=1 FL=1
MSKVLKYAFLAAVRLYQASAAALGLRSRCRFWPTCSQYAYEAVEARGALGHIQTTILGSRGVVEKTRQDFDGCLDGFIALSGELESVFLTSKTVGTEVAEASQAVKEAEEEDWQEGNLEPVPEHLKKRVLDMWEEKRKKKLH